MTDNWYMLTPIGEDKPGIVAAVSKALFDLGMNLGETSMLRLGGNFTIMMMVSGVQDADAQQQLRPVIEAQGSACMSIPCPPARAPGAEHPGHRQAGPTGPGSWPR